MKRSRTQVEAGLQHYVSSLNAPLLSGADEIALARRFADAELSLWRALLSIRAAREMLRAELGPHREAVHEALDGLDGENAELVTRMRALDRDRSLAHALLVEVKAGPPSAAKERATNASREALLLRNRFVEANLRLVLHLATRFKKVVTFPFEDLVQEGNVGLIKAVHLYEPHRGLRFSTYATYWIRQAMGRAVLIRGEAVRFPVGLLDEKRALEAARRHLRHVLGREAEPREVSSLTGFSAARIVDIEKYQDRRFVSLDTPVDDGFCLADTIASDQSSPEAAASMNERLAFVGRALGGLPERERRILTMRVMADATLENVGDALGISRERVRQLQTRAIATLGNTTRSLVASPLHVPVAPVGA